MTKTSKLIASIAAALTIAGGPASANSPRPTPSDVTSPEPREADSVSDVNAKTKKLAKELRDTLRCVREPEARSIADIRKDVKYSGESADAVDAALRYEMRIGLVTRVGTGTATDPFRFFERAGCGE